MFRLSAAQSKVDYGYDRPDFAKYLPLGVGMIVAVTALHSSSLLSGWAGNAVLTFGWITGLIFLGFGFIFLLSKTGKLRQREVLLGAIKWRGDERVLDVGCGPGLLLIGAAKRATGGRAIGIDIWDKHVESKNSPSTTLRNAELEGVADRVEVQDGDARRLNFEDESFDVVTVRAVLHHIKGEQERAQALKEMVRVLKKGGYLGLVLIDFNRLPRYVQLMKENGVGEVDVLQPRISKRTNRAFGTVILLAVKSRNPN